MSDKERYPNCIKLNNCPDTSAYCREDHRKPAGSVPPPCYTEATRPQDSSGSTGFTGCEATDLKKGTWYQSAVSGMWYQEPGAAGDVAQIRLDGTYYIPFKSLKDKGL